MRKAKNLKKSKMKDVDLWDMSETLFENGEYEEALKYLNTAIGETSNRHYLYSNRGLVYDHLKRYEESIKDFTRAIQLAPNESIYYYNRGLVYNKMEKYDESIADLEKANQLKGDIKCILPTEKKEVIKDTISILKKEMIELSKIEKGNFKDTKYNDPVYIKDVFTSISKIKEDLKKFRRTLSSL